MNAAGPASLRRGYVALDLGTARTRWLSPGACVVADRPSALPPGIGVGVPVAATPSDRRAVRTAVAEVAACEVTLVEELPYALEGVVEMTAGLLRRLPACLRASARGNGLLVTGGGAQQGQLLHRLHTALRMPVSAAPGPAHATIRGLTRLCLQPALAAGIAARGR
ncbi:MULTISPECIES: hypothetical protein [unclassified Nonomuraea]|uniref:hypothetical protein n=1 Tax=unclassified Nonomuraea TaxID=2593643 RepID=UPI0033E015CB